MYTPPIRVEPIHVAKGFVIDKVLVSQMVRVVLNFTECKPEDLLGKPSSDLPDIVAGEIVVWKVTRAHEGKPFLENISCRNAVSITPENLTCDSVLVMAQAGKLFRNMSVDKLHQMVEELAEFLLERFNQKFCIVTVSASTWTVTKL